MNKPKEILELEKVLNINLKKLPKNNNIIDYEFRNYFELSEKNEVIGINLDSNEIDNFYFLNIFSSLIKLSLHNNNIIKITNLNNLKNLQVLDLSSNQISEIKNLEELKQLSNLNLSSNQISEIKYFNEIDKYGNEKLYEGKLLIVGEPRHGKTSLRKKLFDIDYKIPEKEELKETLGVEIQNNYLVKNYKDDEFINVNVWDFGGQEKQYPLHQYFLKKNSVFVLVSDDRKDNTNLDKWIYKLKLLQGNDRETILFFNQINRSSDSTNFDADKYRRLGFNFKDFYLDISKDRERFIELKDYIDKSICEMNHIGKDYPSYCKIIAEKIEEKRFKGNKNYLTLQEFEEICTKLGYTDKEIVPNSLNYLDIVGKVIYYEDDISLNHLIIL